jgi:hypothetical protein
MPLAGFEPTIPVFMWEKTFHALDRAATVTGPYIDYMLLKPRHVYGTLDNPQGVYDIKGKIHNLCTQKYII